MNAPRTTAPWVRPTILAASIAAGLGMWGFMGSWASGALFLGMHKNDPRRAQPMSIARYWQAHGDDKTERKKLVGSMALGFGVPAAAALGIWASMRGQPSTHGDARFASPAEVMRSQLCEDEESNTGIILGIYRGQYLTAPHDMHVEAIAPSGSGKTKALGAPTLLNCPYSTVAQDNKRELYKTTSGWRRHMGHKVYRFSPYDPQGATHGQNPLAYAPTDPVLRLSWLIETANTIYPHESGGGNGAGNFFAGSARDVFIAMALYLFDSPDMPTTLGQMRRVARGDARPYDKYLASLVLEREEAGKPLSYDCVAALQALAGLDAETLSDIRQTFMNDMQCFGDPLVDAATSRHDFDWRRMRREPMTVYVEIPFNKGAASRVLSQLLFAQAIACQLDSEWGEDPTLTHEMLWMGDEIAALGRLPILPAGASYVRSYGIHLMLMYQAASQMEGEYGVHLARTISANMRCRVLFAPADDQDAKTGSERLGTFTLRTSNRSRTSGSNSTSTGTTEQELGRALMLAQELRLMPFTDCIIDVLNQRPTLAKKAFFNADPELLARSILPPAEVPVHDPHVHYAAVRAMSRAVAPDEVLGDELHIEQVAANMTELPPLREDCDENEAKGYVSTVFSRLRAADAAAAKAAKRVNAIEQGDAEDGDAPPAPAPAKPKNVHVHVHIAPQAAEGAAPVEVVTEVQASATRGKRKAAKAAPAPAPTQAGEPADLSPDMELDLDLDGDSAVPPPRRQRDDLDLKGA